MITWAQPGHAYGAPCADSQHAQPVLTPSVCHARRQVGDPGGQRGRQRAPVRRARGRAVGRPAAQSGHVDCALARRQLRAGLLPGRRPAPAGQGRRRPARAVQRCPLFLALSLTPLARTVSLAPRTIPGMAGILSELQRAVHGSSGGIEHFCCPSLAHSSAASAVITCGCLQATRWRRPRWTAR